MDDFTSSNQHGFYQYKSYISSDRSWYYCLTERGCLPSSGWPINKYFPLLCDDEVVLRYYSDIPVRNAVTSKDFGLGVGLGSVLESPPKRHALANTDGQSSTNNQPTGELYGISSY